MTATEAVPDGRIASPRLSIEERFLVAAIVYFVALRVFLTLTAFPILDESYYWLWGRNLQLSYYDHPPLEGWLQGLSYALFGHSYLALRWMTWAAFAAELWVFYRVARRIGGENWRPLFLRSTVVFLASPLFGFFCNLAFLDYLLVALVMVSGYLFMVFFTEVEEGRRGNTPILFGAALTLGLAALTKYNGAFLGLAVAGTVLIRPRLRKLLLDWRLYAAAAIALGVQAPVLVWNMQENYVSFRFQMGTRHGTTGFHGFDFERVKAALGEALLVTSPFIIPIIIRALWARQRGAFEQVGKTVGIWVFWLSSLACFYIANFSWVLFWWNIVAFVLIFPFVGRYTRPITLGLHVAWGVLVNTFATITYAVGPVLLLFGVAPGMETEGVYGWPAIAERVTELKAEYGAEFAASNLSQPASQLAYALNDPGVIAITPQRNGFDDWFDPATRLGQDAIIVEHGSQDEWKQSFESVHELEEFPVVVFGRTLRTYRIYLGENFVKMQ